MNETCTFTVDRDDALQIMDALRERLNVWRDTAAYLREGIAATAAAGIVDCESASEADAVAQHYSDIIGKITAQWRSGTPIALGTREPTC